MCLVRSAPPPCCPFSALYSLSEEKTPPHTSEVVLQRVHMRWLGRGAIRNPRHQAPSPGSGQNILRVVASRHATCRTTSCMKMLSHYWEVCSVYRQVTKRSLREGPEAKEVPGNFRCHPAQVRKKRSSKIDL